MSVEGLNTSRISTNFYKLAHLSKLSYTVYGAAAQNSATSPSVGDQSLLELELSIRFDHPRILITYYNKCLYHFTLCHDSETPSPNQHEQPQQHDQQADQQENQSNQNTSLNPPPWDLSKEYPQLEVQHTDTVSIELLTNPNQSKPAGVAGRKNDTQSSNLSSTTGYLTFASLSLIKAVKKLVLYNLSLSGVVQLFGNHAVVPSHKLANFIIHIDPVLLPNGDLLLSVATKRKMALFNSSIVDYTDPQALNSDFIIYLIPSGIRCHLYDNINKDQSFTYIPPKNSDSLLSLLQLSTGIGLHDQNKDTNILWVKLIPNLQHLNNQTSKISKYVHLVDNKKFILWPWKFCLLQFGHVEKQVYNQQAYSSLPHSSHDKQDPLAGKQQHQEQEKPQPAYYNDPLALISDFMDFSISNHQNRSSSNAPTGNTIGSSGGTHHNHTTTAPFSVPSGGAFSAGPDSTGPFHHEPGSAKKQENRDALNADHETVVIDGEQPMIKDMFELDPADVNVLFDTDDGTKREHQGIKSENLSTQFGADSGHQPSEKDIDEDDDEMDDLFGDDSDNGSAKGDEKSQESVEKQESNAPEIIEIDDADDDDKIDSKNLNNEKQINDIFNNSVITTEIDTDHNKLRQDPTSQLTDPKSSKSPQTDFKEPLKASRDNKKHFNHAATITPGSSRASTATRNSTFIDIPKDQMTVPAFRSLKTQTPQTYEDPGAPLPVMPTPIIPQSAGSTATPGPAEFKNYSTTGGINNQSHLYSGTGSAPLVSGEHHLPSGSESTSTISSAVITKTPQVAASLGDVEAPENGKSIFSPLLFNPIIRSNIDTKYGKGGKFYVDKESSAGPDLDSKKRKLRATSVSGYDFPAPKREKDDRAELGSVPGLGIGVRSSSNRELDRKALLEQSRREANDDAIADDDDEDEDYYDDNEDGSNEDEDDEESDEDEDVGDIAPSGSAINHQGEDNKTSHLSPSKATTANDQHAATQLPISNGNNFPVDSSNWKQQQALANISGPLSSPLTGNLKFNQAPRYESPSGLNLGFIADSNNSYSTGSPPGLFDSKQSMQYQQPSSVPGSLQNLDIQSSADESFMAQDDSRKNQSPMTSGETLGGTISSPSKSSSISEASNCLPLILRGINVVSIPNLFLLNNISGPMSISSVTSDFNMDVDEEENDFEINQNNELTVRLADLNEFLKWLGSNLVFDLGLNKYESNLILNLPASSPEVSDDSQSHLSIFESDIPVSSFESGFFRLFPLCYRVTLNEFINEISPQDPQDDSGTGQNDINNQLSFLDDITNDDIFNPKSQLDKLNSINWDSIYIDDGKNEENFLRYKGIIESFNKVNSYIKNDEEHVFQLADIKTKVLKHGNIINMNSLGLRFWKYLNYSPLNGPKKFQLLLISESSQDNSNCNDEFLNSLVYNYNESHFGNITKLNLQGSDADMNSERINNGLLLMNKTDDSSYTELYKKVNKRLISLVELIKLDLINKTNSFEFDRPLLLLFIDFNEGVNSIAQISKICRNLKLYLTHHQLPLVEIFTHVIPASFIFKRSGNRKQLRYLSNYKLSKLSMALYNKCPNPFMSVKPFTKDKDSSNSLFTNLVKEPPSKLQFRSLIMGGKDSTSSAYNDDIFLHLAYERSMDKNWVSVAWSDPFGITTRVKSWYCSPTALKNNRHGKDVYEMGEVTDEIWEISMELFKKLNSEVIKRTSGLGGKKFLVLTRVSSIIPDEELIHWKRLSIKHKDVSLIVLSVSRAPKVLFDTDFALKGLKNHDEDPSHTENISATDNENADDKENSAGVESGDNMMQDDISSVSNINNLNGLNTAGATIAGSSTSTTLSSNTHGVGDQPRSLSTNGGFLNNLTQHQTQPDQPQSRSVGGSSVSRSVSQQQHHAPAGMGSATTPSAPGSAPDFFKNFNNFPPSSNSSPTTTGATMIASPSHNGGINFHSPQQFLNAPGNFLSPQDLAAATGGSGNAGAHGLTSGTGSTDCINGAHSANGNGLSESDVVLHDRKSDITAVVPHTSLPSFTNPSKLGMKVGYLMKKSASDVAGDADSLSTESTDSAHRYLVYETTILSCSNFWKLDSIMKIVLEQFKKLITLNEILGLNEIESGSPGGDTLEEEAQMLVPWHINAVGKLLDYLVHISVEE